MPRACPRSERRVQSWTIAAVASLSGCVPGVPHFVTSAEARAGHPYEDAEYGTADLTLQAPIAPPPAAAPGAPDSVATHGYWHWNGLSYELVPGGREAPNPAYLWRWQDDPVR
ncbi:MAG TPA: hypothetical protein VFU02_25300 [Polyangiaceae bacterium]|nr:hypothetical protein [Polyangiaceae bacterium]